jgi:hypothetical protein
MPDPPISDHENEESEPESETHPEPERRGTPQQRARSETPQRRRARDRDPEDFNFLPQHANAPSENCLLFVKLRATSCSHHTVLPPSLWRNFSGKCLGFARVL